MPISSASVIAGHFPFRCIIMMACGVFLAGCENKTASNQAGLDRAKICAEGGATFDAVSNECACAAPAKWNGVRCETEGAVPVSPSATVPTGDGSASAAATASSSSTASTAPDQGSEAVGSGSSVAAAPFSPDEKVRSACKAARAKFDEKNGYCLCKKGDVLVGKKCAALAGFASKNACAQAVHPGKWKKNECHCAEAEVFSPNLGGCVATRALGPTVNRRVCESTLNRGKWEAREERCACPKDRIWSGARCLPQRELTSRQVCESDYNRGAWDKAKKRCSCPEGKTWRDQRCRLFATVDPKMMCESEANAGKWEAGVSRCLCPGKFKWDKKTLACR